MAAKKYWGVCTTRLSLREVVSFRNVRCSWGNGYDGRNLDPQSRCRELAARISSGSKRQSLRVRWRRKDQRLASRVSRRQSEAAQAARGLCGVDGSRRLGLRRDRRANATHLIGMVAAPQARALERCRIDRPGPDAARFGLRRLIVQGCYLRKRDRTAQA
jgi:hypothetical protein